jgi:peptidoglycan hydrolase CwlO-like protein
MDQETRDQFNELKTDVKKMGTDISTISVDVGVIKTQISDLKDRIDSDRSDRKWLVGTSITGAGVLALILGLFIKFVSS